MREFYVYFHCRPNGIPFYVGKGTGSRAFTLWNNRNRHYKFIVQKYGLKNIQIIKLPSCKSEQEAFAQEIQFIKLFQIFGFELANKTIGGEGAAGAVRSEETRRKMAISKIGNKYTLGLKRGPMPSEQRKKVSQARTDLKIVAWNKGILRTTAEKLKMSIGQKRSRALKKAQA